MKAVIEWLNKPMSMDDMALIMFIISACLFGVTYFATRPKSK